MILFGAFVFGWIVTSVLAHKVDKGREDLLFYTGAMAIFTGLVGLSLIFHILFVWP